MLSAMCRIFLAVGIGFYAYKRGILNQEVNEKLSALIVRVLAPFVILNSVSSVPHGQPKLVWNLFVCGIAMYLTVPLLAWIITKILRIPSNLRGTCMCMLIFSNASFMGYPVVEALYGSSAIFYMTIFNMPFNFLFYTLAVYLIRRDAGRSERQECEPDAQEKVSGGCFDEECTRTVILSEGCAQTVISPEGCAQTAIPPREKFQMVRGKFWQLVKICINPGMLSSAAALVIYFFQIPLPELFCISAEFVGNAMTPLSMIIIGSSLAASSFAEIKTEKAVWMLLPVRLLILPMTVWAAVHSLTSDAMLTAIATLTAAMPIGAMVSIISVPYPRQNKLASIGAAMSTMCSLITIPLLVTVFGLR